MKMLKKFIINGISSIREKIACIYINAEDEFEGGSSSDENEWSDNESDATIMSQNTRKI